MSIRNLARIVVVVAVAALFTLGDGVLSDVKAETELETMGSLFLNHSNGDGTYNCGGGCNPDRPLCYCCGCGGEDAIE